MIDIIICGATGRMGSCLAELCRREEGVSVAAGIARRSGVSGGAPVYGALDDCAADADVLVDFSSSEITGEVCAFCRARSLPLVMCATGQSDAQLEAIKRLSAQTPVFLSANMSLGAAVLSELSRRAAAMLPLSFDIEIIERHHRGKADAPSGTALALARAVNSARGNRCALAGGRQSGRRPRERDEIGIHSIRGGAIVGEHEVMFAGDDEVMTLVHSAASRSVFAAGALAAARFIVRQPPGLYDMSSLIEARYGL